MALFYNKSVFDKYGLTVPTTWDQFVADAKKLHQANPQEYLTSDGGDGLFASSLIWQAGGHPYQVDGTKVTIALQDEGTKKWTSVWNQLVEGQLLSPTPGYTDDWYKQLGNGQIASLVSGAWMPSLLESAAKDGSGNWRAAPMPTYDGTPASANYGGSAQAVLKQSKNQALAAAFVKWINSSDEGIKILMDSGSFPSTVAQLSSSALVDQKPAYFGGQQINKILLDASKTVPSGWQYLPYQTYAQSIFADSVGQSYANHTDLNAGLKQWQDALVKYGNQQGFTVTGQ
jgi:multiple sugar transport system substrate-binding protein